MGNFRWESLSIIKHWADVTANKIRSQFSHRVRAGVFLAEAVVEAAVPGGGRCPGVCGKICGLGYVWPHDHSWRMCGRTVGCDIPACCGARRLGAGKTVSFTDRYFCSFCPKGLWGPRTFTTTARSCRALTDRGWMTTSTELAASARGAQHRRVVRWVCWKATLWHDKHLSTAVVVACNYRANVSPPFVLGSFSMSTQNF